MTYDATRYEQQQIDAVIQAVAVHYGFTLEELKGKTRTARVVVARHMTMWMLRTLLDVSYPKIASNLGMKDHTSAIHGVRSMTEQIVKLEDRRNESMAIMSLVGSYMLQLSNEWAA